MNTKACRHVAATFVLFLVFLFSPALVQGKVIQQRWGPIMFDIPEDLFFYNQVTDDAHGSRFVIIALGNSPQARVTIWTERTGDRGMTLKAYLDREYAEWSRFPGTTRPEKLGDDVYTFYAVSSRHIVMQFSGTDILIKLKIADETDELNKIIRSIRPAR